MKAKLRPLRDSDAEAMSKLLSDGEVGKYVFDLPFPYTLDDAKAFIFFAKGKASSGRDFAVEVDGSFAGVISIRYGEGIYACSAEIGYWLGSPYWGMGIMPGAVGDMTDFAFSVRKLKRVFARVLSSNTRSCRVLEKAGFYLESVQKNAAVNDGRIEDVLVYVKLADNSMQSAAPEL